MPTLALDLSNYSDPLTPSALQTMKAAGIEHVIIQAIDPPAGYPAGRTRAQIQACLDAGLTVDAYVWLWFDLDVSDIQRKLALLDGLPIRKIWLDVEDTAAVKYDQATTEAKVAAALEACDAHPTTGGQATGVYSGRWFWTDRRYMANTTAFADRELWDANYDDVADAAIGFAPYGGWTAPRIKQYRGTSTVAGVGGVDQNVLSIAEAAELAPAVVEAARETPTDYPFADWRQSAIAYRGALDGVVPELQDLQAQLADEPQLRARVADLETRIAAAQHALAA